MQAASFDFVILGSGIAGLSLALQLADKGSVAVVCKAEITETNTAYAQGGIAAALAVGDSVEQHVQDTLLAGAGLCDEAAVRFMLREAPAAIRWLHKLGVPFDTSEEKTFSLALEGGHSQHRVVHVNDQTGWYVQQVLARLAQQRLRIFEFHMGLDLLLGEKSGRCRGVQVLNRKSGEVLEFWAKAVVLATGGSGQLYQHTTNPALATGDGLSMAVRAGANIRHMEFFQFHPTAFYDPMGGERFLISEALRGAGAELVLPNGRPFMHNYHALASLAPRDIVARAVYQEMQRTGSPCLYLDARSLDSELIAQRFPQIFNHSMKRGIDPRRELIPVVPAAHYQCGGVQTDLYGQASIPGLYALGEVACTGVHGANRLASNSLLEGVVFAKSLARRLAEPESNPEIAEEALKSCGQEANQGAIVERDELLDLKSRLQQLMWEHAGIIRTEEGLRQAGKKLKKLEEAVASLSPNGSPYRAEWQELRNLLCLADIMLRACRARKESVGGHYVQICEPALQD